MVDYSNFGKFLQSVRTNKGMSVYAVAKNSGLPYTTVKSYEQGRMPSIAKAVKILDAMGIKVKLVEQTDGDTP